MYTAKFRDLELRISESGNGYIWTSTDSKTGSQIAHADARDLETAMVDAAQWAGADWGSIRWRGDEPEE